MHKCVLKRGPKAEWFLLRSIERSSNPAVMHENSTPLNVCIVNTEVVTGI